MEVASVSIGSPDVEATTNWRNAVQCVPGKVAWNQKLVPKELPFLPEEGKPTRTTNQLRHISMFVIKALQKSPFSDYVRKPVDPIRERVPDYYTVITNPMDLGTIAKRLQNDYYWSAQECINDFQLVFQNCYLYNRPNTEPYMHAEQLEKLYKERMAKMPKDEDEIPSGRGSRIRRPSYLTAANEDKDESSPTKRFKSFGDSSPSLSSASLSTTGRSTSGQRAPKRMGTKRRRNPLTLCKEIVDELFMRKHRKYANIFYEPVDPVKYGIPQYFDVISKPMDLGTIRKKFRKKLYTKPCEFKKDMELMLDNCFKFNQGNDLYIEPCLKVQQFFLNKYKKIVESYDHEDWDSMMSDQDLSETDEPYEFSTGSLLTTDMSTDDSVNLERAYVHLPMDQKRKAIQTVKDYEDGSCIFLRGDKEEINFQSLSIPTVRALKTLIAVYNEKLLERRGTTSITEKKNVLKSDQHLSGITSQDMGVASKERSTNEIGRKRKKQCRRLSSSSSSYESSSENESDHSFGAYHSDIENSEMGNKKGKSDIHAKKNLLLDKNAFTSKSTTTFQDRDRKPATSKTSKPASFLGKKDPFSADLLQAAQVKYPGSSKYSSKSATTTASTGNLATLPTSELEPKDDRITKLQNVQSKPKLADFDSTVRLVKERVFQREQAKQPQRQAKLIEETAIERRVNADLAQRRSAGLIPIPPPMTVADDLESTVPNASPSGNLNNSDLSIVSRVTARTSAPIPTEHDKRVEERKRKIEILKKEAQMKRYNEARSGPMYEYLTARNEVKEFEEDMEFSLLFD